MKAYGITPAATLASVLWGVALLVGLVLLLALLVACCMGSLRRKP